MRTVRFLTLAAALFTACDEPASHQAPSVADDLAKAYGGEEEVWIDADCMDAACSSLWVHIDPAMEVEWTLDGVHVASGDGFELPLEEGLLQHHITAEGLGFVRDITITGTGSDTAIIILGADSCDNYRVVAVGGCITAGAPIRFEHTPGSTTEFDTSPPSLVQRGDAHVAWWPNGSSPPNTVHRNDMGYLFALPPAGSVRLQVIHPDIDGKGDHVLELGTASCSPEGYPHIETEHGMAGAEG
jgi:hypothetical protein